MANEECSHSKDEGDGDENTQVDVWHMRKERIRNEVIRNKLAQLKNTRGARVEDGTAQRDRPLFEILKENKDKKDAEFNERFKHRPPKALDEDETEFLDKLEMSRREYEKQVADEEAEQLRSFQAAVAAKSTIVKEIKEMPPIPKVQVSLFSRSCLDKSTECSWQIDDASRVANECLEYNNNISSIIPQVGMPGILIQKKD
ncbi:hypothetical protein T459_02447 [Capsicum annuum]|uniref:FAM192A/Fyv6 N-terminal domain-containing protein n=1 Tax=Capsicum annuum TaxID=4072 RepID=A0A2G3AJZ8_CAPAN|nr:hypothetical protein T459_02447 [Capsicum annuum]